MKSLLDVLYTHSKGIILLCIVALFVAQLSIHRFDPFHPKSITNDCIQTTVTMLERNWWFVWLVFLAAVVFRTRVRRAFFDTQHVAKNQIVHPILLFDPVRRALREGRLRRLTYL